MNWYNFILSERKSHRLWRHFIFWLLWGIYFSLSFFHYQQAGIEKVEFEIWNFPFFIKAILLLLIHISACYLFISYLMPRYLFQLKYAALIISILVLCCLILVVSYFTHETIFPYVDAAFNHQPLILPQNIWWTSVTSGLLSAPKVICAAAAVKLLKRWWLKQKEKEKLEKEKLITDLQLLKAQMHPEFLFSSLNSITLLTQQKNIGRASNSLLKLADILSYMLYESDNAFVPLEKEIKAIKDYLLLEKTKLGDRLEIDIAVKGETGSKVIVPLLLFPFIESSFLFFADRNLETTWINLEFYIEKTELTMKLIHGKTNDLGVVSPHQSSLGKAMKRLEFFYAGNYELKTTVEPEMMMIHLKIVLSGDTEEIRAKININKETMYAAV
jgi:hypothetical protein